MTVHQIRQARNQREATAMCEECNRMRRSTDAEESADRHVKTPAKWIVVILIGAWFALLTFAVICAIAMYVAQHVRHV